MAQPSFVQIPSHSLDRFEPLLGDRFPALEESAAKARHHFQGRAIWHVSSTLRGGGVAELLSALLPYVRGVGIDTRWVVLREPDEFFTLTKRIHNNLHGFAGDGGDLGPAESRLYEDCLAASAHYFAPQIQPGDLVFLHDPQTAGLVERIRAAGATVVWRCHIGVDEPNQPALRAQDFLRPYVSKADAWVFSRRQYVWQGLDQDRTWTMAPSIDPFSPKNQELGPEAVEAIVGAIGLGAQRPGGAPTFERADGTPGRIERDAEVIQEEPLPDNETLIAQISRWDRLKDHLGLLECFTRHLADEDQHLLLAGPATAAISDDPEGAVVWDEVRDAWHRLPDRIRRRVHLASLAMNDHDENGAMVNAIQRRADVVVQKSLAEGFGLTVAEAMWKSRPVVGARVGGIQDQIVDGVSGILVDPTDPEAVATAIRALDADPSLAAALGDRAHERIATSFLGPGRLAEYAERLIELEEAGGR